MIRIAATAALLCALASATAVDARVCRNSHGRRFVCHKVVAPRVNLKARHPVKVQRCRGQIGRFNNCP